VANLDETSQIRVASEADAAAIAAVTNAAFAIETFLEGVRTDARRVAEMMQQGAFLVAESGSGEMLASVYTEVRVARGYFGMLAVEPLRQGKGLGARLVRAAEDYCRERGCKTMDITVLSLRPELVPFYHRLGYVETSKQDFHPSRPLKSGVECFSIVMSKDL
jgi:predicted N-acetyltransferase YhbS